MKFGRVIRFFRGLARDWVTILFSLVIALLLWTMFHFMVSKENDFLDIPVRIRVPEGWVLLDQSLKIDRVRLRGPLSELTRMNKEQIRVDVELAPEVTNKNMLLEIKTQDIEIPEYVHVVSITPSRFTLQLDRIVERELRVKVKLREEELPDGYDLEKSICNPPTVKVKVGESQFRGIEILYTEPIDLRGRTRSFQERVDLQLPDTLKQAEIASGFVEVEVQIVKRSASRRFDDIPVYTLMGPDETFVTQPHPKAVRVVIKGHQQTLNNLSDVDIAAYVKVVGVRSTGRYELPVQLILPQGLSKESIEPANVNIDVK